MKPGYTLRRNRIGTGESVDSPFFYALFHVKLVGYTCHNLYVLVIACQ